MISKSVVSLLLLQQMGVSQGLIVPSFRQTTSRIRLFSTPTPTEKKNKNNASNDVMLTEMRADIERMKKEATERLDVLSERFIVVSKQKEEEEQVKAKERQDERNKKKEIATKKKKETTAKTTTTNANKLDDAKTLESLTMMADEFERDMSQINCSDEETTSTDAQPIPTDARHPLKLLDNTRWRLCMNVGRVPGTWMPKTWGISGDKLHLKIEAEFTSDELYEREDFFHGISDGSKILRVVNNEAYLAPSMSEGGRTVRVADGGWKVCPNEGPLGTHILRFFFDVEEEARHLGSDVYLPKGRVFGTCGYFPMTGRSNVDGRRTSKREIYQQEIRQMEVKYVSLQTETGNDPDWFSFEKLKSFQEMRDLRRDFRKIQKAVNEEDIKEPKKSSLRLSRDQSVGLTQEGGICCKKVAGLSEEYHLLGKFEVASIENREHSDYRDALLP